MPINLDIVSKFDPKGISQAKSGLDGLGKVAGGFAATMTVAFAAAAAGALAFGIESAKAAAHSQAVARSLEQVALNSGVFGKTTDEVKKSTSQIMEYTKSLSNLTGIDDEILNSIVRGWMAVPDLAGKGVKGLENMVKVVADVAAGTGKDVESVGLAFVKVAGDETTALGKLMRMGIVFTDAQKEMYQRTLDTSGEIAAQDYLIGELGKTYAGAAEAAANPFDVLTQNVKNFQEEMGVYLLPALQNVIDKLREFIEKHGPEMGLAFQTAGEFAVGFVEALGKFVDWVDANPALWDNIVIGLGLVTGAMWALNVAMDANPIGAVILLLEGLVAIVAVTAMNWDKIVKTFQGTMTFFYGILLIATQNTVNAIIGSLNNLLTPINAIIDVINLLGGSLDHLSISSVDFGGTQTALSGLQQYMGAQGMSSFNPGPVAHSNGLVAMATGGIVMGPTPALVGEAGPEAIIPLNRLQGMGGGSTYNITVQSGVGDPVSIGEQIVSLIKRYERNAGPVFVGA